MAPSTTGLQKTTASPAGPKPRGAAAAPGTPKAPTDDTVPIKDAPAPAPPPRSNGARTHVGHASHAHGRPHPRRSLATFEPGYADAPSYRYANLSAEACYAELQTRGIEHTRVDEAPGVLAPVRIPNSVGGVRYHTALPPERRASSPYEVFDCRLVLALHDFSKIVLAHGYDDVITFSGWRPPGSMWPKDKLARRHPGALAVDIQAFRKSGDTENQESLSITLDYHGQIDAPSCGPEAQKPNPQTEKATKLRQIVCEAAEQKMFSSILTPNHDRPHYDHLHVEVTPDVKWRLVR